MSDHGHQHHGTDLGAGVTGFILGAIALAILIVGISRWTSAKYAHEKPAAEASK